MGQKFWVVQGEGLGTGSMYVYDNSGAANHARDQFAARRPDWYWRVVPAVNATSLESAPVAAAPADPFQEGLLRGNVIAEVAKQEQAIKAVHAFAESVHDEVQRVAQQVDSLKANSGTPVHFDMLAASLDLVIDRVAKLENPDITGKGLLGVLDAHNERIGKLEKLTEDHSTRETFSYAIAVDTALRRLIGLLEEKVDKQHKTDDEWARMISDRVRKLEMRKPEAVPHMSESTIWVRAAFNEDWAPNLATLLPNINWVGISMNGMMSGAEKDFEIEDRHWTGTGQTQTLGYVGHLNIDWRASKRKVVR